MKEIKAVIFDLDGTLLDTSEGIYEGILFAIKKLGLTLPSSEHLKTFIGPPIQNSFKSYYGLTEEKSLEAAGVFREYYKNESLLKAHAYDGIYDCLQDLVSSGYKIGVATYKREDYALKILNHFNFGTYCKSMHGSDFEGKLSKSDIIQKTLDELGLDATNSVYVGDTKGDYEAAKKVGTKFLGVLYGFGFSELNQLGENENVISFVQEPLEIIESLQGLKK